MRQPLSLGCAGYSTVFTKRLEIVTDRHDAFVFVTRRGTRKKKLTFEFLR